MVYSPNKKIVNSQGKLFEIWEKMEPSEKEKNRCKNFCFYFVIFSEEQRNEHGDQHQNEWDGDDGRWIATRDTFKSKRARKLIWIQSDGGALFGKSISDSIINSNTRDRGDKINLDFFCIDGGAISRNSPKSDENYLVTLSKFYISCCTTTKGIAAIRFNWIDSCDVTIFAIKLSKKLWNWMKKFFTLDLVCWESLFLG